MRAVTAVLADRANHVSVIHYIAYVMRVALDIQLGSFEFELSGYMGEAFSKGVRTFPKGATLFQEGDRFDGVALVIDGWISTTKSFESGEMQLIDFGLPGDFLEPATADGVTSGLTATAVTDATVCFVPSPVWEKLLHADGRVREAVEHMKAAERARFSERILRLGKGSAKTRIAYAMLEFCVRLDALKTYKNKSFHIPLTQANIGDFTGLSTVHVCRMMGDFVKDGVIETDDHLDIHITDLKSLSAVAGINAEHLSYEIKPEMT